MNFSQVLHLLTPPIVLSFFSKITWNIKRHLVQKKLEGQKRLHLGCGSNILNGWSNIDFKNNVDVIGWDLTKPLPVHSETIELIYCEHFIEHITLKQAGELLAECYRVLQPNSVLRLSTPNLKKLIDEYLIGRTEEWQDVGWMPTTPCQMLNEGLRLWGHQFVYDTDELKRILEEIGYREVREVTWQESSNEALKELECRPFHNEIIFEAVK